jgi:hypothetical protein
VEINEVDSNRIKNRIKPKITLTTSCVKNNDQKSISVTAASASADIF